MMATSTMTSPLIDALRELHDQMWDGERGMDRCAPGVVPGVDISSLNLHAVRETARSNDQPTA